VTCYAHGFSLLIAFVVLVWVDRHQWFGFDQWACLLTRGLIARNGNLGLLQPHNEHGQNTKQLAAAAASVSRTTQPVDAPSATAFVMRPWLEGGAITPKTKCPTASTETTPSAPRKANSLSAPRALSRAVLSCAGHSWPTSPAHTRPSPAQRSRSHEVPRSLITLPQQRPPAVHQLWLRTTASRPPGRSVAHLNIRTVAQVTTPGLDPV
jgi:hypothetical protein